MIWSCWLLPYTVDVHASSAPLILVNGSCWRYESIKSLVRFFLCSSHKICSRVFGRKTQRIRFRSIWRTDSDGMNFYSWTFQIFSVFFIPLAFFFHWLWTLGFRTGPKFRKFSSTNPICIIDICVLVCVLTTRCQLRHFSDLHVRAYFVHTMCHHHIYWVETVPVYK